MSLFKKKKIPLEGALIIQPKIFKDKRGAFKNFFEDKEFKNILKKFKVNQLNISHNLLKGTIRGLHYQEKPFEEKKLIFCIKGRVWDVIVDLRKSSKTYLQWYGIEISKENSKIIFIPKGFAHGFQTLTPNTELVYLHDGRYNKKYENGIYYNDKILKIDWPLKVKNISVKDLKLKKIK